MAGITLAQAEAKLAEWMLADTAVAKRQSYEIDGRKLTSADSEQILKNISYWDSMVRTLSRGSGRGIRVRGGTPV